VDSVNFLFALSRLDFAPVSALAALDSALVASERVLPAAVLVVLTILTSLSAFFRSSFAAPLRLEKQKSCVS